ncbi:glycoside hydrolase family 3 N-terminal domain-containing protein [Flavobacterium sp. CS20]|uniref:glycoside hydrolase family 3 N-terminal domain-containing protein n=1 Tax=Flavobacterium sp. CS20 TaxID=2775246 RepID=UPI001B3A1B81|nr:glycoside hydrolase family 3 N-terminal domain-containing protein [Flavobacterium sp. CS20]QTY27773.1 serine hydrolase [Flavobacterium sp. CS20]
MKYFYSLIIIFLCSKIFSQSYSYLPLQSKDSLAQQQWVDSLYHAMNLDEKIGQLFMVDVFSRNPRADIEKLITKYHIGGIIFSKGSPMRQADLTNKYQKLSKTPLMIAMDAEWGLAMRLDSTYAFPWNMTLGAIKDTNTVKDVARQIAKHNKRLGVHINFAPVVDINTNRNNPIIGNRSFGENKYNVTKKAKLFVEAFDEVGILSSAKHFPGHGDTDKDSHKTLPSIHFSKQRLESVELFPFKQLVNSSLSSIMVAHLNVPALEPQQNLPTSLSRNVVTGLIKEKLGFEGLIFTDALNMKGVADFEEPGEIDLQAFLAGNDILLISENVPLAIKKIKKAYKKEYITEDRLAYSVKKILYAKYKAGLSEYKPIDTQNLVENLNTQKNDAIYMKAIADAITVVKNNANVLPFKHLDTEQIAYLKMGKASNQHFIEVLNLYDQVDTIDSSLLLSDKIEQLKAYDKLIIGHHSSNETPWKSYKFTEKELVAIHEISLQIPVILVNFASPYAISDIKSTVNIKGIVQAYQNSDLAQSAAAQILYGARPARGKLPVSINKIYPEGSGYRYSSIHRLAYGFAQNQGMNPNYEAKIDSIVRYAIAQKMTPGAQILIAKNGVSIYQKNFGYHTYQNKVKVKDNDVYDLASLTKILSTLPLFMRLEEEGKVDINDSLYQHIPELLNTDKAFIDFKHMLSHYARFQSWIPFYLETIEHPEIYYKNKLDLEFSTQVAENFYVRNDYRDSIYTKIFESELRPKLEYKYSDLPFYLLQKIIENYNKESLKRSIEDKFYSKMGINKMRYLPLKHFNKDQIIPTENDTVWRKQLLKGYVHDQGAALLGGIGGHAGLFANANAVAKFMQMYINGGTYGDAQLLKPSTIDRFNTCYFCEDDVRRGVGFDKPQLDEIGPTCGCLSMTSFGHSGFTGTYAWADPEENIVYVFLSNRVHPDMTNRKLISENIRTEIQKIIYENINKP